MTSTRKIIVDAFGGDNAPEAVVQGAVEAAKDIDGVLIVLCGKRDVIENLLTKYGYPKDKIGSGEGCKIDIIDAPEVITNDESPVDAVRKKRDSSIVKGYNALSLDPDAAAFISCGSTGAVLTGGMLLVKRIKGISRAALAPLLPTLNGDKQVMLIDCGANVDARPEYLLDFARVGSAYIKAVFGITNPKIGILSNGTEDKKGTDTTRSALALMREYGRGDGVLGTPLNVHGNVEAREILSGDYDVIVSDGFSGNIALKSAEGAALAVFSMIKEGIIKGGLRAKLGYLLLKPALKGVKKKMDYNDLGGGLLLGLEKIVLKSHGSSTAKTVTATIRQAIALDKVNIIDKIKAEVTLDTVQTTPATGGGV